MSTFFVLIYFTEVQRLFQRKLIFQGSRVGSNIFQGRDLEGGPTFSRWWGGGGGGGRVQLAIPIETLSFFHYVLTPLGTSDGYSGIPSSEGVS